ncbi:site-specific tyrosine recombinase XerD [Sanguibacter sp. HDW7]|uniref:site-specific tyrosine recombinase XerD n=1 Tax=Sanguibacter sp. HDW7 TaxID=2714931 RepID=UPI00140AA25A|nr:site-specific tyrosine recombinase XerD [Sanguibacter sp. HDW7]QIK83479.1 site-specific tyrosine recombinase XerD [Sanguibacter sp. HDW7]
MQTTPGTEASRGAGARADVEVPRGLSVPLAGYLAHLRVERGLTDNTLGAYRRDLERFVAHVAAEGATSPRDLTRELVEGYVEVVRTGADGRTPLAASSTARTVASVRGWTRFCEAEGLAGADPASGLKPPARPRLLPRAIPVDDVLAILEAAGAVGGERGLRDRALLELVYATGARISEAVGLDLDDLELDARGSAVRLFGKGRKERVVPLGSYARDAVEAYVVRARPGFAAHGTGTPALFLNSRGRRLSRQSAWAVLREAAQRAGLAQADEISPHTLRHSFATHLLQGGADVRVVQELLGHASVTTTQIYTLVTPDALREMYLTSHPRARG